MISQDTSRTANNREPRLLKKYAVPIDGKPQFFYLMIIREMTISQGLAEGSKGAKISKGLNFGAGELPNSIFIQFGIWFETSNSRFVFSENCTFEWYHIRDNTAPSDKTIHSGGST